MSLTLSSSLALSLLLFVSSPASSQILTIAAAADLSKATPGLTAAFEGANPKIQLRFVTEASGILSQQIENGAPYDIFMSANAKFPEHLAALGKLDPASIETYAIGRVAILWRDGKHHPLSDLSRPWVRFVALANPKLAPYGAAAMRALEHEGIKIEAKFVYGENVRQALQLFDSGNADVVFTAAALVMDRKPQMVPAEFHEPILQKAGLVTGTQNQKAAKMFLKFLASAAAQEVFARAGFDRVE